MSNNHIKWTKEQHRAINERGVDLLVTASAGTGKTMVLSGRCVDIVSDAGDDVGVMEILVLTFTDMAAQEMQSRIAQQLEAQYQKSLDPSIHKQLIMLAGADISTIHSFCKKLISEHFYELQIDPQFSVIDADESRLLKSQALEKTIEWAWQQQDLIEPLSKLLTGRRLQGKNEFADMIPAISDMLDSVVSREQWYQRAQIVSQTSQQATGELSDKQTQLIGDKLNWSVEQLGHCCKIYSQMSSNTEWLERFCKKYLVPVEELATLANQEDWQQCFKQLRGFSKARWIGPGDIETDVADLIHETAKATQDDIAKLSSLAIVNPEYLGQIAPVACEQINVLIRLVCQYDITYNSLKRNINGLDFADLEHYTLKLLAKDNQKNSGLIATKTAVELRKKYKYIFVDEYQDINQIQRTILEMLSGKDNLFVVGDVKQSIYAFRGAKPEIFLNQLNSASTIKTNNIKNLKVDLTANFRSDARILEFVNLVFERIMTRQICGIDYDSSSRLKPSLNKTATDNSKAIEIHIIDKQKQNSSKDESNDNSDQPQEQNQTYEDSDTFDKGIAAKAVGHRSRQAALIARRIKTMAGKNGGETEFEIFDKDSNTHRPIRYSDIVILLRSPANRVEEYVEVLRLAGIPVSCDEAEGYFEKTEISDCICLLKVLDNPLRDIEFAAVLRSPFFNVTDDELANIKLFGDKDNASQNFYLKTLAYAEDGEDTVLADKLNSILDQLTKYRQMSHTPKIARLLWTIYTETGYLSYVSALPSGSQRRANLLKLHDRAIQFEGFSSTTNRSGLGRFVEFIEKLQDAGHDWTSAEPDRAERDSVRIISVHKSKGLEFPVVFLAEVQTNFNTSDRNRELLMDTEDTLGLELIDGNKKVDTLARQVIAEKKLSTSLAEEMRVLYVAMTRAREKLIITACEKQTLCKTILTNGYYFGTCSLPAWQMRKCRNWLQWLLYSISSEKAAHCAFDTNLEQCCDSGLFEVKLVRGDSLESLTRFAMQLKDFGRDRARLDLSSLDQNKKTSVSPVPILKSTKDRLNWQYHHIDAVNAPAKLSISRLMDQADEYSISDYASALQRRPNYPSDTTPQKVDSAETGTATHLVISELDISNNTEIDKPEIQKLIDHLIREGAVLETTAKCIDVDSIEAFFQSDLGKAATDINNNVMREWPFSIAITTAELHQIGGMDIDDRLQIPNRLNEKIIVQGIADMIIETSKGLIVIDFKTDKITSRQTQDRARKYQGQISFYAKAAEIILGKNVTGKYVWFLNSRTSVGF